MSGGSVTTRYFHKDHLGSVSVLTDESGKENWGQSRFLPARLESFALPSPPLRRMKVIVRGSAAADIDGIAAWIAKDNPVAAASIRQLVVGEERGNR